MTGETKKCPSCAETVQDAAVICRFCRYDFLAGTPGAPLPPQRSSRTLLFVLFGCGAALLTIPVLIGIVAAVAVPGLLSAQRSANERAAASSLRAICAAEADFRANDRDGNGVADYWTGDVRQLHYFQIADGSLLMLLEPSIADADARPGSPAADRSAKAGYWFAAMEADGRGGPYDRGEGRHPASFAFCAHPARYPSGGRKTFIVNEEGLVWGKDTGGEPVLEWPGDPEADGWRRDQ